MKQRNLKVGDKVYIRGDLMNGATYGNFVYIDSMKSGVMIVNNVFDFGEFPVFTVDGRLHGVLYSYEMVDWEKTSKLNKKYVKNIKPIKPTYDGTTLSFGDLKVTRHIDDKEDLEKAVMMLLLKKEGYNFGDVRRIVKNTKNRWIPKHSEPYYYINAEFNVAATIFIKNNTFDEAKVDANNCFKTREKAEEKSRLMKKILHDD